MNFRTKLFACIAYCVTILIAVSVNEEKISGEVDNMDGYARHAGKDSDLEGFESDDDEGHDTDHPTEFFRFQQEIRTRESESAPGYSVGYRSKALSLARSARASHEQARVQSNGVIAWTERGPGNVPGRTRAIFNIPLTNNNTWLAGAATGGIWKTSDGGTTWLEKNENLTALPISAFAADANATVIYAATGELVSSAYSAMGDGIFKSTDKGETWNPIPATQGNPDFAVITRLIVDPANPSVLVATTAPPSTNRTATKSSIMRSTNGGTSWSKTKEVTGVFDQIIYTPGNFMVQYASQYGVGVWKSQDGGISWSLSNTGMSISGRAELAVSPINPNKVFASAEGSLSGVESDLYVSINAGATWSLVDVKFNNGIVDFLGNSPTDPDSQGFYDNTIICDPFNENIVYFGGVSLFRLTLGTTISVTTFYSLEELGTTNFLSLIDFSAPDAQGRLDVGPNANEIAVEIRFGPTRHQKAHRFLVPDGATSGVADADYSYQNYVDVPFEAWDVTNNRQLMVSFRDQGRDGAFNLIEALTSGPATSQSREYIYVHDVLYSNSTPNPNIKLNGGHIYNLMYNIWPVLASGGTWPPVADGTLKISASNINKINATTITAADGYGNFDSKNIMSQTDPESGVHVDHHTMTPVITDAKNKIYKILLGNDGGVFVSNVSTTPGTTQGSWQFKGYGYNTSQFYGADKAPGADRYIGGMQDNGTRVSPSSQSASAKSQYSYALGGDGFEAVWNSLDNTKILGSVYYGQVYRTVNSGTSWQSGSVGLGDNFPFITKLACNKDFPNQVFTVSGDGVYVSQDFASTWKLTAIPNNFVSTSTTSLDVEVSRANASIVWAGSGMSNVAGQQRKLYVSEDGGATFTPTQNYGGATMGSITKLASHPTEPRTAYAIFSFAKGPKILRTKDLGQTWKDISGFNSGSSSTNGFPDVAVYSLYVRPDNPSIIWAGTEIGIVESQDDGATWSLVEEFPKVSVWDMVGQDDQVVIATHGRGIWTATINLPQSGYHYNPEIIASGTSPAKKLVLRIKSEQAFDSLQILVDAKRVKTLYELQPGTRDVLLSGVTIGSRSISLVSYDGSAPSQSKVYTATQLNILDVKNNYATYFSQITDLTLTNVTLQTFSNLPISSRKTLQTNHPYTTNNSYTVLLRTPVKVSSTFPKLFYADVAIVVPETDSVLIEATRNGIDWVPLSRGYDARKNSVWQNAYAQNLPGLNTMLVQNEIDLSSQFEAGDSLLFRLRMISGPSTPAWGWAIDFVSIQQPPVSVETPSTQSGISIYPNPATSSINVRYEVPSASEVNFTVLDLYGRVALKTNLGDRSAGENSDVLNVDNLASGTYVLLLTSHQQSTIGKFVIKK